MPTKTTTSTSTKKKTNSSNKTKKKNTSSKTTPKKTKTSQKSSGTAKWKNLVIVESPAKSNTIKKFLWKDRDVASSMGHIIDLPKKWFWVEIENNFEPTYEIMPDKKKTVNQLKKLVKNYEKIWIATDEDREWEAIGWHLISALNLKKEETPRIVFHEITKDAINNSVKNPRTIDENLVNSQQARRILDRVVWFKVSPVLWEKVKRWLSAGRVQSVAVKLIVEKERQINDFVPQESWKVQSNFQKDNISFVADLEKISGKKINLKKEEDLQEVFAKIWLKSKPKNKTDQKTWHKIIVFDENLNFEVEEIKTTTSKRSPSAPFITSTLQQEASNKLWWWVKQVMSTAQKLYENWFITYMRTDSVNLSSTFIKAAASYINSNYGKDFSKSRNFKTKSKSAQEAHEAIRPTDVYKTPQNINLSWNEKKLYDLIWIRSVASQMSDAIINNETIKFTIQWKKQEWITKWQTIKDHWFMKLWIDFLWKVPMQETIIPKFVKAEKIKSKTISAHQHFTKPPARYTESSLVKKLESEWIGRPSTYAPTISTIIERGYVQKKDDKRLHPTDIAFLVTDFLDSNFQNLMDYNFTAQMESKLDKISEWKQNWVKMLSEFWKWFSKELEKSTKSEKAKMYVNEKCPECSAELVYKFWKTWKFIWCENYPDCKYITSTKEEQNYIDQLKQEYEWKPCPEWWNIVVKVWRYWPFLASDKYPEVKWIWKIPDKNIEKLNEQYWWQVCDKCWKWKMVVKKSKRWPFLACDDYPKCKNAKSLSKSKNKK